ncbi:Microtubule effector [Komagataella phaffii CBS 7435]|uniref:Microtubule effector required for tubulin heterodimer formation n=2 Tax=Komagataella phaffii TaxID=460519 RepID=C4R199_KOMPG|nr:Microtubule effector required for tubulin heterodimer formation [Komagataella phaffii GS115]AOA62884.1 GQ67_00692T0 [Komagataella phaffii]CAH2448200.1 Microtubule effector [Komagataella phaffii CBS 7435]AOA67691.1 GQ68_00696T0 [Komagataella phaffii GS115]CAY69273.1 Microtubule effector required for tubulin heterodimer formation [Komagataella phaffii GS115]CCA38337.1 Microtubule effector [Komagataella phaffii CBS 7435]
MNATNDQYRIGDRVSVQGDRGTIRYVGEIEKWPGIEAIGIDWDRAERGKNNGTLNGVCYFKTQSGLKSASFIKNMNKFDRRRHFIEAIVYKYGNEESLSATQHHRKIDLKASDADKGVDKIQFGTKMVESYGFDNLSKIQGDFFNLEIVSLATLGVYKSDLKDDFHITELLPNLVDLDLSSNLLKDLSEVFNLIVQLPKLQVLNLNENRFTNQDISACKELKPLTLKTLQLTSTYMEDLSFLSYFPELTTLALSGNNYSNLQFELIIKQMPQTLSNLDFSHNHVTFVDFTMFKTKNIETINLFGNNITKIIPYVTKVSSINFNQNQITEWPLVDEISQLDLRTVSITFNPLFENSSEDQLYQLLGRLNANLSTLDGSIITATQKESLELYFIQQVKSHKIVYPKVLERWRELCDTYNVEADSNETVTAKPLTTIASILLNLNVIDKDRSFPVIAFPNYTVLKLKGSICEQIDSNILQINIYFIIKETSVRQQMDDDLSTLNTYGLSNLQNIYVERVNLK